MSAMRRIVDALLSTEPLSEQRPFWPVMLIGVGGLLVNGRTLIFAHQGGEPLVFSGISLAVLGLILTARYYVKRAQLRRAGHSSSTKAI